MIAAKIVADSVGPNGKRITTYVLTYPRFIHSEFMTHRALSRNAASSRAIPCKKMRASVFKEPAMPISFSQNKAGMQAAGDISPFKQHLATALWKIAGYTMCCFHWALEKLGVHKQHANRVLEPWLHMTVVVTATDWDNFFGLRLHPMAQPEFQELAKHMFIEREMSKPEVLKEGFWHLPFVDYATIKDIKNFFGIKCLQDHDMAIGTAIRISVARCARVSYLNHEGKTAGWSEDFKLYDRLLGAAPIHASPAEHQAQALAYIPAIQSGNFTGWGQYRKTLKGENITNFTPGMFDERK